MEENCGDLSRLRVKRSDVAKRGCSNHGAHATCSLQNFSATTVDNAMGAHWAELPSKSSNHPGKNCLSAHVCS